MIVEFSFWGVKVNLLQILQIHLNINMTHIVFFGWF